MIPNCVNEKFTFSNKEIMRLKDHVKANLFIN